MQIIVIKEDRIPGVEARALHRVPLPYFINQALADSPFKISTVATRLVDFTLIPGDNFHARGISIPATVS